MLIAALMLALAAPAGAPTTGFTLLDHISEPGMEQVGYADNASVHRAGDKVDLWENWVFDKPVAFPKGKAAYFRRHYVLDCAARTTQMTDVEAYTADGQLLEKRAVNAAAGIPPKDTVASETVAFYCDGVEFPWPKAVFETWDAAYADARTRYGGRIDGK
jgi:hypothetical protein